MPSSPSPLPPHTHHTVVHIHEFSFFSPLILHVFISLCLIETCMDAPSISLNKSRAPPHDTPEQFALGLGAWSSQQAWAAWESLSQIKQCHSQLPSPNSCGSPSFEIGDSFLFLQTHCAHLTKRVHGLNPASSQFSQVLRTRKKGTLLRPLLLFTE